jgi:geranylgeranyl diphosphate synthase type I
LLGIVGEREKFGKPIGSDVREGKRTIVILRALKVISKKDRRKLLSVLGSEKASRTEIEQAIDVLKRSGALDYAVEKAREFVAQAKSKLGVLPDSEAKQFLLELADFTVEREF